MAATSTNDPTWDEVKRYVASICKPQLPPFSNLARLVKCIEDDRFFDAYQLLLELFGNLPVQCNDLDELIHTDLSAYNLDLYNKFIRWFPEMAWGNIITKLEGASEIDTLVTRELLPVCSSCRYAFVVERVWFCKNSDCLARVTATTAEETCAQHYRRCHPEHTVR